jgi:hypothetical protein
MATQSIDTNPEVEKVLISLLRKLSVQEKLNRTLSFSLSIIKLSKQAISKANPSLNEDEKNLLFVKYNYGTEIANKLHSFNKKRLNEIRNY